MSTAESAAPVTPNYVIEISTAAKVTPKFTVDGEEYSILTFDHLSADDEAAVTAMMTRFERLSGALEMTGSDAEAKNLAIKLREKRVDLLTKLTTMPRPLVDKLPLPAQNALLQAIQPELTGEDEEV